MRKPIRIALMAGTAGVIAAGGVTAALAAQGNSQQTLKTAYSTSPTVPPAPGQVSAQQARQTAQQWVPGARVTETERDREHGRVVWEVDLTKNNHEYEVRIDAAAGTVIGVHHDSGPEHDD